MAKKAAKKVAKKAAKKVAKPTTEPAENLEITPNEEVEIAQEKNEPASPQEIPIKDREPRQDEPPSPPFKTPAIEDLTGRAQMRVGDKVIRSPLVCVLGHIDHGKTSILDYIRGTVVQKREVAGITQHIGASFIPIEAIKNFCGPKYANMSLKIPGLLVVDTPGHTAFMNLRKRGGAVADIAILVIEVPTGPMPTTWESVRILRGRKTPFIIAANKIDRIAGWQPHEKADFLETYNQQKPFVKEYLDQSLYQIIGDFSREGFSIDRYDHIEDFTKDLAIVPTSAKTGEGIPTLLIVLTGLVQQYLQDHIRYSDGPGNGVVLEVKNEPGYGNTIDCLLYDGYVKKGDEIVVGSLEGPVVTKVRALLRPKPLDEMRDPRNKFDGVDIIYAAAGVKILAPNLENVVAGSPFRVVQSSAQIEQIKQEIEAELNAIQIKTEKTGVVVKADTLGALEALVGFLQENNVKIHKAAVGPVTRNDIIEAVAIREKDPLQGVVLSFAVKTLKDAQEEADDQGIRVFSNEVIYRLLEEYQAYVDKRKAEDTAAALSEIVKPGKFQVIPEYIFHQSNPAIFGVKVLAGEIHARTNFVRAENGEKAGNIHQIQDKGQSLQSAKKGEEVAVSVKNITIGRQVKEDDVLFVSVPESHVRLLMGKFREQISEDSKEALREYVQLMRKKFNAWWGA